MVPGGFFAVVQSVLFILFVKFVLNTPFVGEWWLAMVIMLMIAIIELTSGALRNGVMTWYFIFADQVKQTGAEFILKNWGLLLCFFGIVGGFAGGDIRRDRP